MKKFICFLLSCFLLSCSSFSTKEKKVFTSPYELKRVQDPYLGDCWRNQWLSITADDGGILFSFSDIVLVIKDRDDFNYFYLFYNMVSRGYIPQSYSQLFVLCFYDDNNYLIGREEFNVKFSCRNSNSIKYFCKKLNLVNSYKLKDVSKIRISAEKKNWIKCSGIL